MRRVLPVLALSLLAGCYYVRQAAGQIDILLNREQVEQVIASGRLTPDEEVRLRLVVDIKEFGENFVMLMETDNYTTYYEVGQRHVSYIVSASAKDSFKPYIWSFPIVGDLPYKGFFDLECAREEARALKMEGYDVTLSPVAAYSTLGYFSDPVFSTMLRMQEEDLANLILHELTHSTVYVEGRADFNENLASFVGTTAAVEYIRRRFGSDSHIYRRAIAKFADRQTYAAFIARVMVRLNEVYQSDLSREEKLDKRGEVFSGLRKEFKKLKPQFNTRRYDYFEFMRLNNADLLGERLYANDKPFQEVFDRAGQDWRTFWKLLRASLMEDR